MTRRIISTFWCVVFIGCAQIVLSQRVEPSKPGIEPDKDKGEIYRNIRSRWTVSLGPAKRAGGGPMLSSFSEGGGGEMRGGDFPLMVEATLMDSEVVQAGLSYYAETVGMSLEEADSFRQDYWIRNNLDKNFLVETSLQTMYAENYLDLSRWTVFVEDDEKNQHTPVRIKEKPTFSRHAEGMSKMPNQKRPMPFDYTRHEKIVFFYFPKQDFYGQPIIRKDMKELKIVFILEKDGKGKAEGRWTFTKNPS